MDNADIQLFNRQKWLFEMMKMWWKSQGEASNTSSGFGDFNWEIAYICPELSG